jgi:hypothetical protein
VPDSTTATVDVRGRPEDRRALARAFRSDRVWAGRLSLIVAAAAFTVTVIYGRELALRLWEGQGRVASTFAAFLGLIVFVGVLNTFGRRRAQESVDPRGTFVKGYRVSLADDGVHIESENLKALHRWNGILKLHETPDHLFLYTDGAQAIIVPKRCFGSAEHVARFAGLARDRIAVSRG